MTIAAAHPVAAPTTHADRPFDQGFTLQGVSIMLGLVVAVLTILGMMRKTRRENEADARARTDELKGEVRVHNDSVEKRLIAVEGKIVDFMPRIEIEGKIEHERRNRIAAQDSTVAALNRHSDKISGLEVCVGKVEQKQDGMAADMAELKGLLRDLSRDVNAKLDKQQECLNSISRKAP